MFFLTIPGYPATEEEIKAEDLNENMLFITEVKCEQEIIQKSNKKAKNDKKSLKKSLKKGGRKFYNSSTKRPPIQYEGVEDLLDCGEFC